jgi:hypothetical protein
MASKKRSASNEKELKATIAKLRSKLERAETRAEGWKKNAGHHKKALGQSEAQVKKLQKRLAKANRPSRPGKKSAGSKVAAVVEAASSAAVAEGAATPDESWTVVQLREEARARGLTGLSGKPKAELLAALA